MKTNFSHLIPISIFPNWSIVLFLLVFFTGNGISQSAYRDSLEKVLPSAKEDTARIFILNELCWEYAFDDPEKSLAFGKKASDLSLKSAYWKGEFFASRYMARTCFGIEQGNKGEALLKHAIDIGKTHPINDRDMALAYNDLGIYLSSEVGEYEKALELYFEGLNYAKRGKNKVVEALIYVNICYAYHLLGDDDQIPPMANEAAIIFKEAGYDYQLACTYTILGSAHVKLGNLNKAKFFYENALPLFSDLGAIDRKSEVLNGLGNLYEQQNKWDLALDYYNQSLEIDLAIENQKNVAISYSNIAGIYFELGKLDTSTYLIEKALEIATEYGELPMLMTTYLYASENYKTKGEYEQAYNYLSLSQQIKDSIYSQEKRAEIIRLQEEYEAEKRKEEIRYLETENDKIVATSKLNYTLLISGISALLMIIVIGALIFKMRRDKEARTRSELERSLISLKSTALMAQLNPHLVFNVLNSIQGLVASEQIEKANTYISKFSKLMRQTLNLSQSDTIGIDVELSTIRQYFELEQLRFPNQISLEITNELPHSNLSIPPLLLQPLIENSIKHGIIPSNVPGSIKIHLFDKNGVACIKITDNGVGFKPGYIENDGLRITLERLKTLNPKNSLTIDHRKDPTVVEIMIHYN